MADRIVVILLGIRRLKMLNKDKKKFIIKGALDKKVMMIFFSGHWSLTDCVIRCIFQ